MQTKTGWHRADIIAAVHKRGTTLRQLSLKNGLAESTLRSALLLPRTPSNRIIAAFLGLSMHELWPQWFDAEGVLRSSRSKGARADGSPSSQKRKAA